MGMKIEVRIRLLVIGYNTSSRRRLVKAGSSRFIRRRLTTMKGLPKSGCGVLVGLFITLVAGVEAILKGGVRDLCRTGSRGCKLNKSY